MYKNILVATDGSRLAGKGIREGVRLAKALGARVTGVYVAEPFARRPRDEAANYYAAPYSRADYNQATARAARKALGEIEALAREAKLRFRVKFVSDARAWRGILRAAAAEGCDAIVMASHGHGAVGGLILGSETARVLAHSKLPVLVAR